MKNRYDLIIFDWDGTLINTIDWIVTCLQNAAVMCQCPVPDEQAAKDIIGLSIDKAVSALFPETDTLTRKQLVQHYSQRFFSKRLSRDDLFEGVYDMLIALNKNGFKLAVATGKGRVGLQQALDETDTEDLFCITRCADETESKPNPVMLQEILAYTGVPAERALMVGDSIHDLQMAANARIASVGVSCGAHSIEVLQRYGPLMCLPQTSHLLNLL
ncbi:MAG: HAD-IA family hydrolase [Gammaproteobacteria bacterium]